MAERALELDNVRAGYGETVVLEDIRLALGAGETVSVIGRNGVGKTTLLATIMGHTNLHGGRVVLHGNDISKVATYRRVIAGLGYVPQEHSVFGRLSVRDNLAVGALTNRDSQAVNRVLEIFPKLGQRMDQVAGTLSGGERKMLAIGRALLSNPRILLLDEPTEGVWIGVIEEGDIHCDGLAHAGIREVLLDAFPVGFVGQLLPALREMVLTIGMLNVG